MATSSSAVELPQALQGDLDVLMIDNFDSFTWNLYQHLSLLGAEVTVVRNDAILPEHFPLLKIKHLIVSPGPGHPKTDSGVSKQAIEYFAGKIPVLGVCMGLECMVDLYGGEIGYAGEIMHGKVSRVRHDGRGCFKGLPQSFLSTRYHSLSTQITALPPQIAITSTTEESGVIMGVRHRQYTVEGVQYHPESILSASGDDLLRNFLKLQGGTWEENPASGVLDPDLPAFPTEALPAHIRADESSVKKVGSILEKIYAQRQQDIDKAQNTPGTTMEDLFKIHALNISPPLISFDARLRSGITANSPALLAEIKRASPSKGHIAVKTNPAEQALKYALAGASTISVLTEPHWFLGSLQDMLNARNAVANLPNRPAILRKDFVVNRYQVLESRIWGADTILLIVAMLPESTLRDLYTYSVELGMEPLVEVNSEREMQVAISLGAKVIGINNRNLHNFNVDMDTTSRVGAVAKDNGDIIICALSGISNRQDVEKYKSQGVGGILVGESLMRAADTGAFVRELLGLEEEAQASLQWPQGSPLVKICGIRTPEEAVGCAEAGVDFLGLNFVPTSKRVIDVMTANLITGAIKSLPLTTSEIAPTSLNAPWFTAQANRIPRVPRTRPLIVALFQDAPLSTILSVLTAVDGIDIVQLHGKENLELAKYIPRPVIKAFNTQTFISQGGYHHFALIDSASGGGSGVVADWSKVKEIVEKGEVEITSLRDEEGKSKWPLPVMLAGGLNPTNVAEAVKIVGPWAVDVAGGVELEGGKGKDLEKVKAFVEAVKGV